MLTRRSAYWGSCVLGALLLACPAWTRGQISPPAENSEPCGPFPAPASFRNTPLLPDDADPSAPCSMMSPAGPAEAPEAGDGRSKAPLPSADPGDASRDSRSLVAPAFPIRPIRPESAPPAPFQWKVATRQVVFMTAVMHGWRFAHELGTRDATGNGPWFHDWMDSVAETRGWDDGDGWHASFVGHPLNGAVYGFIEQQNDPKYSSVEWGDGRIYWMSRLRALAFSTVASAQWTLGPVSEASLGNVQLHSSPGFIDLVNTPGLGVMVMMGEDLIDRYAIIPLENHTSNPFLLLVGRSFMNPTRSFANLMGFKAGWHRATRPGLFGANHARRRELVREYKEGLISAPYGPHTPEERALMNQDEWNKPRPLEAPVELHSYALYESFLGGGSCVGAGGQGALRLAPAWQVVTEVNGCLVLEMPKHQSGDSLMFAVGPRWTPRAARRFSPFLGIMVGGRRVSQDVTDTATRAALEVAWHARQLPHYPKRSDYSTQTQEFGLAMTGGGGFDLIFGRAFAWRVVDVQYSRSWLPGVGPIDASEGVQIRSGVTLRLGTW